MLRNTKIVLGFFTIITLLFFASTVFASTFADNFDDGNADGWSLGYSLANPANNGNWRVESGELVQDSGYDGVFAVVDGQQFTTQTIETNVKMNGPSGGGGIIHWFQDNNTWSHVMICPSCGYIEASSHTLGIDDNFRFSVAGLSNDVWYKLKVEANSSTGELKVYLDDSYLFSYTSLIPNKIGKSGVINGNAGGYFDNFQLTTPAQDSSIRLTFSDQREDWPMIFRNTVYWSDGQIISGHDFKNNQEVTLASVGNELPNDFYAPIGYDGRYLVYNTYSVSDGYNVSFYDFVKHNSTKVTDVVGTNLATDYDQKTIVYIEGYGCGKLHVFNIARRADDVINDNACSAKISGNTIVWYGSPNGDNNVYGYDLGKNEQFDIASSSSSEYSPDIFDNQVVWVTFDTSTNTSSIVTKNLNHGDESVLQSSTVYTFSWPSISKDYVVWGKDTVPHVSGIEGYSFKSGEVFEIQEQGPHQNGNMSPLVEGDIAAWMAWRTGNGDIYAAELGK